jgi:ribosomal protein L7/L12
MPKCHFCKHNNPVGIDRCQNCGAWIEQKAGSTSTDAGQRTEPSPEPESLEAQVLALMGSSKKIEAIKLYRQQTGCGLKEAKDAVEALAVKHGIVSKGAGCAGVTLAMLLACGVLGIGIWFAVA